MSYYDPNGPIWISAGEASGDLHGALLAQELRKRDPGVKLLGLGGPAMREAGVDVRYDMQRISLVGLTEIIPQLPDVIRLLYQCRADIRKVRPRAVVLTDCPEFHFRLARIMASFGIPVYYYISPQIWAWRSGRVNFLKKYVRKVLCILPFEKQFYADRDMDADYIGNPLMDKLPIDELDAITPDPLRIGILPGSRRKEISTLLPEFAEAAYRIQQRIPEVKFTLVRAPGVEEGTLRERWPNDEDTTYVGPEDRYRAIRECGMVLAASGTVTLECALIGTPTLVAYKLSPLSYHIAKQVINVQYASLPNLILDREVLPELLQHDARGEKLAEKALEWLETDGGLEAKRAELAELRKHVGGPGAAGRAADIILDDLRAL